MGVLAIVLARAGSKGLPGKNALPVAGRPMLDWTLAHALDSQGVSRVVLSTDGDALKAIAAERGVAVIDRPGALAHDTATVADAARHALAQAEARWGESYDAAVILYGNVPVRPGDLTNRALGLLFETGADSVQSVCSPGKAHPYWMKTVGSEGELGAFIENTVDRRQDLPPVYLLDGGVIAVTRTSLMREPHDHPHAFLGDDRRAVVTQPGEVVDVDSETDLRVAAAVLGEG